MPADLFIEEDVFRKGADAVKSFVREIPESSECRLAKLNRALERIHLVREAVAAGLCSRQ